MKMVMAVVPKQEADGIISELVAGGHTATFVESRGGVLRQASEMLFIVVEDKDLQSALSAINRTCHYDMPVAEPGGAPAAVSSSAGRGPQIGGAVVFVWSLEQAHRY